MQTTTTTTSALPSLSVECAPEYQEVTATETQEILVNTRLGGCSESEDADNTRAPLCVTAVVDRSGSMSGQKLNMVKKTLDFVTRQLKEQDNLGVVTYDDRVTELLQPTPMHATGRTTALNCVEGIAPGGCTNLAGGLYQGLEQQLNALSTPQRPNTTTATATPPPTAPPAPEISLDIQIGNLSMGSGTWTAFVQAVNNDDKLSQYIKSVTFTPIDKSDEMTSCHAPEIVNQLPFQVQQKENQTTTHVRMELQLQAEYNGGKTLEFEHELKFESCLNAKMHTLQLVNVPIAPTTTTPSDNNNKATVHAVWLFTDGLTNSGDTNPQVIMDKVRNLLGKTDVPIRINTFGYGSSHNVDLLRSIAEVGNGMYYYVEDPAEIGQAFVECLGGLLSVVAQNIKVTLHNLPGAEVTKVFTHFPSEKKTDTEGNTFFEVKIVDIFAEEHKDLLCKVKLNSLPSPVDGDTGVLRAEVTYKDTVNGIETTTSAECSMLRPETAKPFEQQVIPDVVDQQRNRVKTAEAFEQARAAADQGNLDAAKDMMRRMKQEVLVSKSAATTYCGDMMDDMDDMMDCFGSASHYAAVGKKVAMQTEGMWKTERSACVKGKDRFTNKRQKELKSACPRK